MKQRSAAAAIMEFVAHPAALPACPADPSMHAISYACTSPNDKWWVGQSMDNQSEPGGAVWRGAALRGAV